MNNKIHYGKSPAQELKGDQDTVDSHRTKDAPEGYGVASILVGKESKIAGHTLANQA